MENIIQNWDELETSESITLDGYEAEHYKYPNNCILILEKVRHLELTEPKKLVVSEKQFKKVINNNGNFKTI